MNRLVVTHDVGAPLLVSREVASGAALMPLKILRHSRIYYDLLINKVGALKVNSSALIEYAFKEKRVIIVSPTSFLAYLQTVMQGLRALQIEESAKQIMGRVEELGRHIVAYDEYFKKLGNNLQTTVNAYNTAYKELGKIDKDVMRITGEGVGFEVKQLEKPAEREE
jgi:DNA recombination protein RmuC